MANITVSADVHAIMQAANYAAVKNLIEMTVSQTDITDTSYRYYGGLVGTAWKINRYSVTTYVKTSATIANNSGQANLAAAWANRLTLTYA